MKRLLAVFFVLVLFVSTARADMTDICFQMLNNESITKQDGQMVLNFLYSESEYANRHNYAQDWLCLALWGSKMIPHTYPKLVAEDVAGTIECLAKGRPSLAEFSRYMKTHASESVFEDARNLVNNMHSTNEQGINNEIAYLQTLEPTHFVLNAMLYIFNGFSDGKLGFSTPSPLSNIINQPLTTLVLNSEHVWVVTGVKIDNAAIQQANQHVSAHLTTSGSQSSIQTQPNGNMESATSNSYSNQNQNSNSNSMTMSQNLLCKVIQRIGDEEYLYLPRWGYHNRYDTAVERFLTCVSNNDYKLINQKIAEIRRDGGRAYSQQTLKLLGTYDPDMYKRQKQAEEQGLTQ